MMMRENFLYYVLGMVNLKLMTKEGFDESDKKKHTTNLFHAMNTFLADCNESPMMPYEIDYIDNIRKYDKKLNDGMKKTSFKR